MEKIIKNNTSETLQIPNESGEFRYVLEGDARLHLHYIPGATELDQYVEIVLEGDGSSLELRGMFRNLSHATKLRLHIIHRGKDTDALVLIRGVIENADGVANIEATIRVEQGATGTDTYYQADFINLADGSTVRTQPNLEIHESDIVGAGHGSSYGLLDQNQLQYLEARGLTPEQAKSSLVEAFLADIEAEINNNYSQ